MGIMSKVRAMVIDDSAFMRKVITNILLESGTIEVIATARNGLDALEQLQNITPDVITLDLEMPVMNGLEFLAKLMKSYKIPVVMLSSLTSEGAVETIRALELGAVDFITKTSGPISLDIDKLKTEIVQKVEIAARIDMNKLHPKLDSDAKVRIMSNKIPKPSLLQRDIVAIGTSTGGPRALQEVLTKIPAGFPAPILIVQHMPPGFTKSLAERLDTICSIRVCEGSDQQVLENGVAYIAPGNYHMTVHSNAEGKLYIKLDQETPPLSGHRPSVDILYESISVIPDLRKFTVIMTGMGSDGSRGLKKIKEYSESNTTAIAEHESTCVVYGMPRSAIQLGLIDHTVQLNEIGKKLVDLVMQ